MATALITSKSLFDLKNLTQDEQILINTIRNEIEQGKLVAYWKGGKYIKKHLLKNKKRANYGKTLFPLLSEHLRIDVTTLYRSVTFYEEYPRILATWQELTWSHYRILLTIPDVETRRALEKRVIEEQLSVVQLQDLIRESKGLPQKPNTPAVLSVSRDEPYVYLIKESKKGTKVDLGFRVKVPSPVTGTPPNTVVHVEKDGQNYRFIPAEPTIFPHYTYKANLINVIDGDTLWVNIDLGFETEIDQKLRLRGINSAELDMPEGKTVRDYVVSCLKDCAFIAIKSHARDKFDRYLVDVFYDKDETNFEQLIQKGHYLNQELLDKGFAEKYDES